MSLSDRLSAFGLLLAAIGLFMAYCQLREANSTLQAANTIALSRDAREITEKIAQAGTDAEAVSTAYDYYGDFIAHAGYLHGKEQLPDDVWTAIEKDFCLLYKQEAFKDWYARNQIAPHIIDLYPGFRQLQAKCQ